MDWGALSPNMQGLLGLLRHASSTIDYDVRDAVEDATNEEDFVALATVKLDELIAECEYWKTVLQGKESVTL